MSKRRLFLLAFGILVVGGIFILTSSHEPSYHGRELGAWVEEYGKDVQRHSDLGRNPSASIGTPSEDAIRHIGTNAIPCLLRWIRYEKPTWKQKLLRWANNWLPGAGPLEDHQEARAKGAMLAFRGLGSQAMIALPELARLLNSPGKTPGTSRAGQALAGLGADALPAFLSALTNSDPGIRWNAAFHMQYLGTNALVATPQFVTTLSDSDRKVVWAAAQSLGMLKADPPLVVPELQALLANADPRRRVFGAMGLAHYATLATSAVPALLAAMNTTNQDVRFWCREAILKIDPKAMPNPVLP